MEARQLQFSDGFISAVMTRGTAVARTNEVKVFR
jgi:hypothetical protein